MDGALLDRLAAASDVQRVPNPEEVASIRDG
jgi:hypothetical protein